MAVHDKAVRLGFRVEGRYLIFPHNRNAQRVTTTSQQLADVKYPYNSASACYTWVPLIRLADR